MQKQFVVTELEGRQGSLAEHRGKLEEAGFTMSRDNPAMAMPESVKPDMENAPTRIHGIPAIGRALPDAARIPFSKEDHERAARFPLRIVSPSADPEPEPTGPVR
jgi:hypothetical protein